MLAFGLAENVPALSVFYFCVCPRRRSPFWATPPFSRYKKFPARDPLKL